MARDRILSAIDIGSSKIVTLVAVMTEEGEARIIGVSTSTSRGLRKSQVVNIDEATAAISSSLEAAERMAGTSVAQAFVSVGGKSEAVLDVHELKDRDGVLEVAVDQSRILVTRNSRDFAPLLREWAEAGRHHAGCILIWTLDHSQFGPIVRGVSHLLDDRPDAASWTDLAIAL